MTLYVAKFQMQTKKIQVVASLNLYNEKNENDNEEQAMELFSSSKMAVWILWNLKQRVKGWIYSSCFQDNSKSK